jgi:hypothetical protein
LKYIVQRKCHGFRGRLWEEGEVVEIGENENPPHHFKPLETKKAESKESSSESKDLKKAGKPGQAKEPKGSDAETRQIQMR